VIKITFLKASNVIRMVINHNSIALNVIHLLVHLLVYWK